jgi:NADH-quinone oxidoreductase subunit K
MLTLNVALGLSAFLFAVGAAGVIVRRNAIILFMCIELMLNAVNLAFVALSPYAGIQGQVFVFFVIAVAAAEAAVGLAIIISLFRHSETVDIKNFSLLRW